MSGVGVLLVGLLLCFAGVASVHLAVLASGFALGWVFAESLGGSLAVIAVVALAAAVTAWILATFVLRAGLFVVGAVAGGVIGAKVFGLLQGGDDSSIVVGLVFVVAIATLTGFLTQRFHEPAVALACALGGAGLALSGAARMLPDSLGFLRTPETTVESVVATCAWVVLAAAGWTVERRVQRRRTGSRQASAA
jgi:hypothetical protein